MHTAKVLETIDQDPCRLLGTTMVGNAAKGASGPLPSQLATATKGDSVRPFRADFPDTAFIDLRRGVAASEQTKLAGIPRPFEKEYFHKDGSRAPAPVGVLCVEEAGAQAVALVVDSTEWERVESRANESERQLREARMQLAHANRVATLGQLTASIAHEVNQPTAAVLVNAATAARWLARRPPNLEKARPLIERIITDGKRTADIVSLIRDFSKNAPARGANVEINEAILEIMILARAPASEHRVLVTMQLSEQLPRIFMDRVQLQQVILNLIMNAIESMAEVREGSRELMISTREADPRGVLVEVRDSGPGLPPANHARIFEPFYTTKSNGLGMGLSICRSIVEARGGRLWAAPNEPRGAVFRMMLPIGDDSVEEPEWARLAEKGEGDGPRPELPAALLIETARERAWPASNDSHRGRRYAGEHTAARRACW